MAALLERQQFTPEGQELPAWLSYQAVTTTIDGVAVTTGTILELPLTYYGPSIPLGPDWVYGGETSPAVTPSASAAETSSSASIATSSLAEAPAPSPSASSVVTSTAAVSSSFTSPSSTSEPSTAIAPTSSISVLPFSSLSVETGSISAVPSSNSVSSSSVTTDPSSPPTATSSAPPAPAAGSDNRTTLLVLLPSILGPLLLALLILLLCFCLVRRRQNSYTRAPTTDPSVSIPNPIAARRASTNPKLPFTPPRSKPTGAGTTTEKAPLLTTGTAHPTPAAEPEEEDIADYAANPHRSSILSRLSLGLGIAPTMRVFSGGGAENAYRTPSWALAAGIARRISSGFRTSSRVSAPIIVEKPAGDSRGQSTTQPGSGNDDTTTEPQSAGYARTMGDDELFYRPPGSTGSGEAGRGSRSSRGTGSSGSRSTRGTGPSNWQSAFPVLEEDDSPLYATPGRTGGYGHERGAMGNTVSVGVPETPRTGAGSIGSASFLGMEVGERDRRSRWVEEGERMEFPVPPGMYGGVGHGVEGEGMAVGNRDSMISTTSGNTNYYSANSRPDTPPAYNTPNEPSTIRLVQPLTDENDATLRGNNCPILSSRLSSSQRGSDNTRRSFIGEPLLGPPAELAEFGQLRSVSGGQINTLISAPQNSNNRSSHYASIHVSDSSRSMYSQASSGSGGQAQSIGGVTENLVDVGSTFGVVSDRALRGRRSHATLVSARSVRLGQAGQTEEAVGGVPAVPPRNPARPPPMPRLSSERTVGGGPASKEGPVGGARVEKKRSWLGWKKDKP